MMTLSPGFTMPVNSMTSITVKSVVSFSFSSSTRPALLHDEVEPEGDNPRLGHGLHEDDPRRDRPIGEMPAVEIFVLPEPVGPDDVLRVQLQDLVDEAEGFLLRHRRQDPGHRLAISRHRVPR